MAGTAITVSRRYKMKKTISIIAVMAMMLLTAVSVVTPAMADVPADLPAPTPKKQVKMIKKSVSHTVKIVVDGKALSEKGVIRSGRTFLPIAVLGESLGLSATWNQSSKTAIIGDLGTSIEIKIGASQALINGQSVSLDAPAFVLNGRTMVPVAFVAQHLGIGVSYDAKTKLVSIDTQRGDQQTPQPQNPTNPEPQQPPSQPSTPQPGKIQKVVVDGTEVPFEVINGRTYVPFNSLKSTLKIEKIAITHPFNEVDFLHFENNGLEISFTTYPGGSEYFMEESPHGDINARAIKSSENGWLIPVKKIIQVFKLDYHIENSMMSIDSSKPGFIVEYGAVDSLNEASRDEFYEWRHYGTVHGIKYKGWDKDQGGPIQPY